VPSHVHRSGRKGRCHITHCLQGVCVQHGRGARVYRSGGGGRCHIDRCLQGAFQRGRGGKGVEGPKSLPHRADAQPWAEVRTLAHETWFVECALDAAMARVAARQVRPGSGILHPP